MVLVAKRDGHRAGSGGKGRIEAGEDDVEGFI